MLLDKILWLIHRIYLYNIFFKSLLHCRQCKTSIFLQQLSNVYTFYRFHQNTWTYILNIIFIFHYWFSCLSVTDWWQYTIDSKGLDFVLQTDQWFPCVASMLKCVRWLVRWCWLFFKFTGLSHWNLRIYLIKVFKDM